MGRSILGVLAGLVVGMVVAGLVEGLGMQVFPPPVGMNPSDPASIAVAMQSMPATAFLFLLAAWWLSAWAGTFTAGRIAKSGRRWPGLAVGTIILAATLNNLRIIPHPWWVAVSGVVGILFVTLTASTPRGAPAGANG